MNHPTKHRAAYRDLRKGLRLNMTVAESLLWERLRNSALGPKFRRQISIGRYIVDFVSVRPMIVIEVDGGVHDEYPQIVKDRERDEILRAMGYRVLRFKNEMVIHDIESVIQSIANLLSNVAQSESESIPTSVGTKG